MTDRARQPALPTVARPNCRTTALVAVLVLAGLTCLGFVLLFAAAWYYSGQINSGALAVTTPGDELDLRVVSVGDGRVELAPAGAAHDGAWTKDGIWGVEWPGGYATVGRIVEIDKRHVIREFEPAWGAPQPGDLVRFDSYALPLDPQKALGAPFLDVRVPSANGDLPAWLIPGGDTWVVFVHGRAARKAESLRLLATTTRHALTALVISYRNDDGAPASGDGRYGFGKTEWPDLEIAVAYARDNGAHRIVLAGSSMGGAIVIAFLQRSSLASLVSGVVLDAPMLDFGATIDDAARRRRLPGLVTSLAKALAARRYDVDWRGLDYLRGADSLRVPVLLFHGDADTTVPVRTSDALARARPDIVTYYRVAGATHVRSWNMDPSAYDEAVRSFLERVTR